MQYTSDAGYNYEITRLNYYLSGFVFRMTDGSEFKSDVVFYIDAKQPSYNDILFPDFSKGSCAQISFFVGVDSLKNKTDSLLATTDNINMLWPDMMGGGYHFMKLEGHYIDTSGTHGFAMHLGKNKNLVRIMLDSPDINSTGNTANLNLTMNINEWFRNPQIYDFNKDGSYSMGNDSSLQTLANNGTDIFN